MKATLTVETTVRAFAPEAWNRCFPEEPEDWDFYLACEEAGPPGFSWLYFAVWQDGELLAAVPAFATDYRLDTTVQGFWKRITSKLVSLVPRFLSIRLVAFGSPVSEICHLGFAPGLSTEQRQSLLQALVTALMRFAGEHRYGLIAVKDVPASTEPLWREVMRLSGFTRLPGLPTATLDVPFASLDDYLKTLGPATRKDMRRKLRALQHVRIEHRRTIDDVLPRIAALYDETVAHSDLQFEHLPPDYFAEVLEQLGPRAGVFLYWAEEELVAFNLVIEDKGRLIDKYIGMHYPVVRRYNPYFISWFTNVRYCIERGIPVYQSGQAFYAPKVKLGCRLTANWQYFRHRNGAMNGILRLLASLVRLDRFDPEIAKLVKASR